MIWLVPIVGIIALLVALALAAFVKKQPEGNDKMKEIAAAIHEGAQAFLFAEYKVLIIFVVVVFIAVGIGIDWKTAICFVIGALFSTCAGYIGMNVATRANVRTTNAAQEGGMTRALPIAFRRSGNGAYRSRSRPVRSKYHLFCNT